MLATSAPLPAMSCDGEQGGGTYVCADRDGGQSGWEASPCKLCVQLCPRCLVPFCHVAAFLPIRLKALGNRDETFSSMRGKGWGRRCGAALGWRGPDPAASQVHAAPRPPQARKGQRSFTSSKSQPSLERAEGISQGNVSLRCCLLPPKSGFPCGCVSARQPCRQASTRTHLALRQHRHG